jgi:hypothetical protein
VEAINRAIVFWNKHFPSYKEKLGTSFCGPSCEVVWTIRPTKYMQNRKTKLEDQNLSLAP